MPITTMTAPTPTGMAIGRRVHLLMWDARLTQMELGERIGMDQSSLARRIRGERGWTPDQLVAVADALGVTVAYLFGESDQAEPEEAVAETA